MPEPNMSENKEEIRRAKEVDLIKLHNSYFMNLNVTESKDPAIFRIKSVLSSGDTRGKQDELAKLCFDYLMDNKSMAWSKTKRERFENVLNTLGVLDSGLANYVVETVNNDMVLKSRFEDKNSGVEKLDATSLQSKTQTNWHSSNERTPIKGKAGDDPRIENIKELLKRLQSKDVNPWHHFNSEKFDKMVKSIEHTIEYANAIDKGCGSVEILDKMFDEVKANTLDYISKKSDSPDSKYGKSRINLALATLLSVDRDKGMQVMDTIANKRLIRENGYGDFLTKFDGDISKMKLQKDTLMSLDKIIKETGYKDNVTREEMADAFKFRMENINNNAFDPEFGMDEMDLASFIVYKTMSEMFPNMADNEWTKFDVSIEEIDRQSMNVMASDPFLKAHMRMFDSDPFKQINPDGFFMAFKVTVVETSYPHMDNASASYARVNTQEPRARQPREEEPRQSQDTYPGMKDPKAEYKEMKEYLHMDESATYNEVRRTVMREMGKHHPDRHSQESEQELNKHIEIFQKLNNYKDSLDANAQAMKEVDNSRSAEMSSAQSDSPARRM